MKISQTMKIIILLLVLDIYCCFLAAGYVITLLGKTGYFILLGISVSYLY